MILSKLIIWLKINLHSVSVKDRVERCKGTTSSVEVDSKGGVVIEDRNKDSKPEVTIVLAVEVSSVLKGKMVGAVGFNKNNRSDCDSSEVIANEEVTYSYSKVKGKMSSIFERIPIGLEGVISWESESVTANTDVSIPFADLADNSEVVVEYNVVCDRDIAGIRTETELCEIAVENDCDDVGKMEGVIDVSKRSDSDCDNELINDGVM